MSVKRPYHKYVFDTGKRAFVGNFEEMYKNEEAEKFDSWFQENVTELDKLVSLSILRRYNFTRILDVGCGKGVFTHLLKKNNNYAMGIDISRTAVNVAKRKYPDIDFVAMDVKNYRSTLGENFDLIIAMEILSYLKNWGDVINLFSKMTRYLYLTVYIPEDPIGFVKNFGSSYGFVGRNVI